MRRLSWVWVGVIAGLVGLGGCGGGAPAASAPAPVVASNLAGNWLVTGSLPQLSASNGFDLTMTFDVYGNQVTGVGAVTLPCGIFTLGPSSTLVTGTVLADGSFSLQTPTPTVGISPNSSVSIQGAVPKTSQGAWSGSYTVTSTGFGCPGAESGTFTATPIQAVTGTYAGSLTLTQLGTTGTSTQTPVKVQMTLQQGGTFVIPATGKGVYSNSTLTGSVEVTGTTCFASGKASTALPSAVEGDLVAAIFTMDDGSQMRISGTVEDVLASRMSVRVVVASGGRCGQMDSFPAAEFVRQG